MNVDESSQCNPVPPPHLSEEFKSQYPVPETVVDEAAFRRREANAVAIGTAIGCAEKKIKGMWNQLMLEIYPVWSHRSKRGDDRVKGRKIPGIEQETWTPWNEDFCARTGLHPKAVERHIMAYRVEVLGLSPQPSARKKTEGIANPFPASAGDDASAHRIDAEPQETAAESHRTSSGRVDCVQPAAVETRTDEDQDEDADFVEEDEYFPLYPRVDEDVLLKLGDRSGLLRRIKQKCRKDFVAVLGDLPPNEQASILDFVFKGVTQSCSPAVRRGSVIKASAEYDAPPLQARKGEPCIR